MVSHLAESESELHLVGVSDHVAGLENVLGKPTNM